MGGAFKHIIGKQRALFSPRSIASVDGGVYLPSSFIWAALFFPKAQVVPYFNTPPPLGLVAKELSPGCLGELKNEGAKRLHRPVLTFLLAGGLMGRFILTDHSDQFLLLH